MNSSNSRRCMAIVPAAGRGLRMGGDLKKQYLLLGGEPVLARTLRALEACDAIDGIILVVPPEDLGYCQKEVLGAYRFRKVGSVVPGGLSRQDSVFAGLRAVSDPPELAVVHDGVRPFVERGLLEKTIGYAAGGTPAIAAVPVSDTIKSVDPEGTVIETLRRDALWSIQTPQAFPYPLLLEACESAFNEGYTGTDDASLVERMGHAVRVVMGSHRNIKITSPADLILGEAILKQRNKDADWTRL